MATEETQTDIEQAPGKGGIVDSMMDYLTNSINNVDEKAAANHVAEVQQKNPDLSADALADILIKRKCYRTGAVGAITSGLSIVPGIGTVAALTFGTAADIGMTFKLQAELVLEIAAVYNHPLSADEKRNTVLLVTGIGAGSHHLAIKGGEKIARKVTERFTARAIGKAVPFISVGVSAGANILTTYIIGQRAKRYFSLNKDELEDFGAQLKALTGIDEAKIVDWLYEATQKSQEMVSATAQDVIGGVIVAGQKSEDLVVIAAGQTSQGLTALVGTLSEAAAGVQQFAVDTGKKLGDMITLAGRSVIDTVDDAAEQVASSVKELTQAIKPDANDDQNNNSPDEQDQMV